MNPPPHQFRVTKYDPVRRNATGAFLDDDWTSASQVGALVKPLDYLRVENAYIEAALAFLTEAGVTELKVDSLENVHADEGGLPLLADGSSCSLIDIADIVRLLLREKIWCRLMGADAFVHVGRDYYMYVGVSQECPAATAWTEQSGLFVERFRSSYLELDE